MPDITGEAIDQLVTIEGVARLVDDGRGDPHPGAATVGDRREPDDNGAGGGGPAATALRPATTWPRPRFA
mgnify:CR=1 FL=1